MAIQISNFQNWCQYDHLSHTSKCLVTALASYGWGMSLFQVREWYGGFREVINELLIEILESNEALKFVDIFLGKASEKLHLPWLGLSQYNNEILEPRVSYYRL